MKDPVLAIFVRTDLNMSRGKIAVQVGHAAVLTMHRQPELVEEWMENNQVKIVLAVNSLNELDGVGTKAVINGLPIAWVEDAGSTEVESGTYTCMAVGIAPRNRINKITTGWKTLR